MYLFISDANSEDTFYMPLSLDVYRGNLAVTVIIRGNGVGDMSSNPGQSHLCFTFMGPPFLLSAIDK